MYTSRKTVWRVPEVGEATTVAEGALRIEEADLSCLEVLHALNVAIFGERRIINTFERDDLVILLAYMGERPVGFKVGYRESAQVFYSAKGGVLPEYRGRGVARQLLHRMIDTVRAYGYTRFAYDTFPNKHPGMTVLGLSEGFAVVKADYNALYRDYRLRFEKKI